MGFSSVQVLAPHQTQKATYGLGFVLWGHCHAETGTGLPQTAAAKLEGHYCVNSFT